MERVRIRFRSIANPAKLLCTTFAKNLSNLCLAGSKMAESRSQKPSATQTAPSDSLPVNFAIHHPQNSTCTTNAKNLSKLSPAGSTQAENRSPKTDSLACGCTRRSFRFPVRQFTIHISRFKGKGKPVKLRLMAVRRLLSLFAATFLMTGFSACNAEAPAPKVEAPQRTADLYEKLEFRIPMRDGVKLYTAVYVPKNKSVKHPMMIERSPYGSGPYGPTAIPGGFGGSQKFVEAGYIFVNQDVRGRHMSEGKWMEIRPLTSKWKDPKDIDEATDTYDTVDFLVKNVPNNNGRVGFWGVSYPGFYAACAAAKSHPAIKAVSPQAPVSEWFLGDDVHHNGAFFLQDNFDFYFGFGYDMDTPAPRHPQIEGYGQRADAYKFFLELGSAINADTKYYKGRIPFWNDICNHPAFDEFWQARSTPSHIKDVKCAVLTVGGLFDAEDLYGGWAVYKGIEKNNPGIVNKLIVGPWSHGGWGGSGQNLNGMDFGQATGPYYREEVEFPFFDAYLRGDGKWDFPEARVFNTGANQWKSFTAWPPAEMKPYSLYFQDSNGLSDESPAQSNASDAYESDPANPIPYQPGTIRRRSSGYMNADQRFLADRKDILRYQTATLDADITLGGPVNADLYISTTGTDCDLIAKVIDVEPDGTERLIRWEVMRAQFLDGFSKPRALKPGQVEHVKWTMPDMLHTFKKGHKIMVQVQSSWFPLIDRNPHIFTNIYKAKPEDYKKATITVHRSMNAPSSIRFGRL